MTFWDAAIASSSLTVISVVERRAWLSPWDFAHAA